MSTHIVSTGFDPIEIVEIAARERSIVVIRETGWRLTLRGATFEVVLWANGPMALGIKAFEVMDLLAPVEEGVFV
jgi:hypothetical protein